MYKGAANPFPIERVSGGQYTGSYVHGENLVCNSFRGTLDDPTYGSSTLTSEEIRDRSTGSFSGVLSDSSQPEGVPSFVVDVHSEAQGVRGMNERELFSRASCVIQSKPC